ncbi:MAG: hypothetical protein HY290_19375 [Planctomycetia bacterium]|nr:hypothetical protein [Planctomycetia bacterium]
MRHAFWCGLPPSSSQIRGALESTTDIQYRPLGNLRERLTLEHVADCMARVVADDGVVGIYQGAAETGPRALGHRSILANPCNPDTLQTINRRVKYREPIRPLAPMMTLAAARRFFRMSPGAADDDFNAYSYMVLAAQALSEALEEIPAVVHKDGTSRLQIVREEHDPLMYAYLKAMGRRLGVEVSVNTSLNVGSPIVQTPEQALGALKKAQALSGLVMVADDGDAWFVWRVPAECPAAFAAEFSDELPGQTALADDTAGVGHSFFVAH